MNRNSWTSTTLGKVYDVRDGTHDSPKYQNDGYPLVTSKNLKENYLDLNKIQYISETDYLKINERSFVSQGDVLFAMIGTIGNPVVIIEKPNFAIKNVALFKVPEDQDSFFLKYYLQSNYVKEKMQVEAKGTTQKFVGLGYLRSFPIILPPLKEQKRIVAILDEAFAGINQAIANTEKNLANARELFESYIENSLSQPNEDWTLTKLGNEIELLTGFAFKSQHYTENEHDIKLLRGDNIIQGCLRWDDVKKWSKQDTEKYKDYLLNTDDFVLAMDRTWVKAGIKFAQLQASDLPCLLVQRVARLRVKNDLDPFFLRHLLQSRLFERYVLGIQTGLGVPHISGKQISEFSFKKPSKPEQLKLSLKLNNISSATQSLIDNYTQKLQSLTELKQSLLQKAFSGELTANNVDKLVNP